VYDAIKDRIYNKETQRNSVPEIGRREFRRADRDRRA